MELKNQYLLSFKSKYFDKPLFYSVDAKGAYWGKPIETAKHFNSVEEIEKILKTSDFENVDKSLKTNPLMIDYLVKYQNSDDKIITLDIIKMTFTITTNKLFFDKNKIS